MNITTFRTQFPEFSTASNSLVQAMLDAAAALLSESVFGEVYDQAHAFKTAHMLAISPFGRNAKLANRDGSSTYEAQYLSILSARTQGYRVC